MSQADVTAIQEDYLETILVLQSENGTARLTSMARHLGLSKSTVSTTLQILRKHGLVVYEPYKTIALTASGTKIARQVLRRHQALRRFLVDVLLVDEEMADETACKIEHCVPKQVLDRIVAFTEFVEECPHSEKGWLDGFGFYCTTGALKECDHCNKERSRVPAASKGEGKPRRTKS
jgi:DtxR family Mn-dependent transcriptional regulator